MTQLAIGRAFDGLDVSPSSAKWDGDTVTLEGPIYPAFGSSNRFDTLKAARDRFNALVANRDEPIVAVTFSEDSSMDGFYRPLSASMQLDEHHPLSAVGRWQCVLQRAGGGAMPQVETVGQHFVRTNPHSITNTSWNTAGGSTFGPHVCYPGAADDVWAGDNSSVATTRTSASGAVTVLSNTGLSLPVEVAGLWTIPPASHYVGACHIRTTYGSATSLLVGGRFCPTSFDNVTLSNDLIRLKLHPTSSVSFEVEVYDGSQWEDLEGAAAWSVRTQVAAPPDAHILSGGTFQILRNSPEECAIRVIPSAIINGGFYGRVWYDFAVKRGSPIIWGMASIDYPKKWSIQPDTAVASTALTGGLRATANDAAGNRAVWGVGSATAVTATTGTGVIQQNSDGGQQFSFCVGVEIGGSGATGINTAQNILYEWFDARSERQSVVRR